jgi:DDE superfamily endonuclease
LHVGWIERSKTLLKKLPERVAEAIAGKGIAPGLPVEIWFQDEMRVGQKKNGLVYQWAKKGTRPRQPKDQRYANAYVFGAICPARDIGTALVLPRADVGAMQRHLDEISRRVTAGAHAVLTLDKAGWHTTRKLLVPSNINLLHLPPASPELNPTENIWQYLRQTYLSNRVFGDYDDVVEASSSAWNKLVAQPGRIASIGTRSWTAISQGP